MRPMTQYNCSTCQKLFLYYTSFVKLNYKNHYCSRECQAKGQITSINVNCALCNNLVVKKQNTIKRSKSGLFFCNSSCSATYSNSHKTKGCRISKFELYVQEKLTEDFSDISFQFNKKDRIKSELDIFIPKLNLAFEINGIFHYTPIYGVKKYKDIIKNDFLKQEKCSMLGIDLYTIDVSKLRRNTNKMFINYYTLIKIILEQKLKSPI